jgi:hypothetical protein
MAKRGPSESATTRSEREACRPRNPKADRYVVEIRDATGASLLLTRADWTDSERDLAISAVLRLVGMKALYRPNGKETNLSAANLAQKQRSRGQ